MVAFDLGSLPSLYRDRKALMSTRSESRPALPSSARLQSIREVAPSFASRVLSDATAIARVPAPTNDEGQRSKFLLDLLRSRAYPNVSIDELGDVVVRIPGRDRSKAVLLAAHLDTVFPHGTSLQVFERGDSVSCPGIGDNSLGVACVIAVPDVIDAIGVTPAVDLLLTGNVGEEGLGNLRGMRAVMDAHADVRAVIAVEGHNLGRVTHVAVGSRRLRVTVVGPGGHSWGDFGNASAIQAAADIIHELGRIQLPSSPKTTLNVGMIKGGISINTIAPEVTFDLDLRSTEEFALKRLTERTERIVLADRNSIHTRIEVIGERPAGFVSPESLIVRRAVQVLEALGIQPAGDASSTDANIPIGRGIPAVCIGLTSGGNVHREDEYIETIPVPTGLAQLTELTLALADDIAAGEALDRAPRHR